MAGFGGSRIGTIRDIQDAIYVANAAERLALTGLRDGQLVVEIDTNMLYSWDVGSSTFIKIGGSLSPSDIDDTNTIDHTVIASVLTSDVVYQDTNTINMSDDASGLKADLIYQDSTSIDLSDDASGLKAEVLPAGVDHNALANTHNLTTDIDHTAIVNIGTTSHADIDVALGNLAEVYATTKEPTGFPNITDSSISFDNGTRTFTIQPTGVSYDYWIQGVKYTKSAPSTIVIPDDEGAHFIYFNGAVLSSTQVFTAEIYLSNAYVANIHWDEDNNIQITFGDERHGCVMDGLTHYYEHALNGTEIESGGELGDIIPNGSGDVDTHAQFSIAQSIIWDEDLRFDLTAINSVSNKSVYYRTGLDISNIWRVNETASYPVLTAGTGRAAYNQLSLGSWALTEVSNSDFVLAHVFAFNDLTRKFGVIVGQAIYTTLANARAGAEVEINSLIVNGLPFEEFKFLGTLILQTDNGYSNAVKARIRTTDSGADYVDLRGAVISRSGVAVTVSDHNSLAGIQGGAPSEFYHLDATDYTDITTATNSRDDIDTHIGASTAHGTTSNIVGVDDNQSLTNKTIDADSNTISNLEHGSEVDDPSSGVHGVVGDIVGTSDTQALTAKDVDGGTASDTSRITIPKGTTIGLTALTRKEATLVYDTDEQSLFIDDGSALQPVGAGSVVTTEGDIIVGNAGGEEARLAIGGNTTVLTSNGTTASWAAPGVGSAYSVHNDADDYIILDDDGFNLINFTDTSSDRTCTLPTAADNTNRVITIINTSTDKGKVTADGEGAETISDYVTVDLDCKGARLSIISDGSNWQVLEHFFSDKTYTPTVTATGWTTTYARCVPYRGIDGIWHLRFNISGTPASEATNLLVMTGVSYPTGTRQGCVGWNNGAQTTGVCYADGTTDAVVLSISSATTTDRYVSGDVVLDAKPTFVE